MSFLWQTCKVQPVAEYRFAPPRRWRFDFCWPQLLLAVEQDGGIWVQGRHNRGSGYIKDLAKFNEAARLGYRVFKFQPKDFIKGTAQLYMAEVIATSLAEISRASNRAMLPDQSG